jgi:hypothetical protein
MKRTTIVKLLLSVLALVAVANHQLVTPACAADLNPGQVNTFSCNGDGIWHFVNNQTGTTSPGTLTVTFSCGTISGVTPSKINQNVQQFLVTTTGNCTLVTASTNLPGNLVLSDLTCAAATPTPSPTATGTPTP